ncbi:MerR family transcriptional regulator [Paenibacillus peoriae]|uniref:MerR family transcriptional regulator n=1 Tax=Paenibacillus peoriae TaxID=59893 RepID=UPI00215A92AD|nr:MerR family transcriptional regulator [Paenibacillus peoriae]
MNDDDETTTEGGAMKKTATMTEISEQLKIPRTTLNEWRQAFEEFIPCEGEGRSRRYILPDSLEVFQTIAKLKQKETSTEDISKILQKTVPMTIQEVTEQEPALFMGVLEGLAAEMRRANELKEQELTIRLQEIQEQRQYREQMLERLERRNDDVTQALVALREAREQAAASSTVTKRKWWKFNGGI